MLEHGWTFEEYPGATTDPLHNSQFLSEVYVRAQNDYSGRVTVPVLWDKVNNTIAVNESAEIINQMNNGFDCGNDREFYPEELKSQIDEINSFVYDKINNGVYKAGFATTQEAYDEAVRELFSALDVVEERLSKSRYLVGNNLTIADIRLFTTLVRFDCVYVGHFKCNLRRIEEYENLSNYLRELYQIPEFTSTVNFDHIKNHYYRSQPSVNPTRVVPIGPHVDYMRPHNRDRFSS